MSKLVPITEIKTTRILSDGRSRLRDAKKNPAKFAELVASMQTNGQLQPIVIEEDGELVAGERRLLAAKQLGWTEIDATVKGKMTDLEARTVELEENLQREDMDWRERTYALAELHKIKTAADPNWSMDVTAAIAGVAQARVTEAILINKMVELFPEIGEAKSHNQALSWSKHKAASITRVVDVNASPEVYSTIEESLLLGDSIELIKTIPDESFDLVLTDPPFGINYDHRKEGTGGSLSSYEDGEENYLHLLSMAPNIYRVIKKNGWLIWFLGPTWYERAKIVFRGAGFLVDEIPVVWDRSDGRAFTTRPDRYFGRCYDIALHCIKGDPQIVQRSKPNIIRVPPVSNEERELVVERPVELYAELIRRLTVEGESVADFFVGSGSCLAAAASLKRKFFGIELDPERRAVAIQKIKNYIPEKG